MGILNMQSKILCDLPKKNTQAFRVENFEFRDLGYFLIVTLIKKRSYS